MVDRHVYRVAPSGTTTGRHTISFMSIGPGKLYINGNGNGKLALDRGDWTEEGGTLLYGSAHYLVDCDIVAGQTTELKVEMNNELHPVYKQKQLGITHKQGRCRIGFKQQDQINYMQEAVDIARTADVAVVIVGLDAK